MYLVFKSQNTVFILGEHFLALESFSLQSNQLDTKHRTSSVTHRKFFQRQLATDVIYHSLTTFPEQGDDGETRISTPA